ncbi:MAG TPA: cyclase family protein [Caldithrix sp.]|nr:cyclase family protein [Caldithrix sp.]
MNRIYDVTLPLHNALPVWPGDPISEISRAASIEAGEKINLSRINASLHWGTHIDAPYHLNAEGWTIDQIPVEILIGAAKVVEIPGTAKITADHLRGKNLKGVERVLFKTRNSQFWNEELLHFHRDFTAFSTDAAHFLLENGCRLIGIDYLSIDLFEAEDLPVHKILYARNVVAIEGLDLRKVPAGDYQLLCLPLKIPGGDGAPAKVLLHTVT